jgi:transcription elongation factor GreB
MSKAFQRESDFDELPELPRASASLPPGVKNLMTAAGAERLRGELRRLVDEERPPLASRAVDYPETRGELLALDQRIRLLRVVLESAEIVDGSEEIADAVRFGSVVTVRERDRTTARYHIAGVDETDVGGEAISWQSPLARALLNARVGDRVVFQAPAGRREIEIVAIA